MTDMIDNRKDRAILYKKIAAVTAAVSRIPKNGFNSFHRYKYATESDITDGLRELLTANGLAFLPPSVLAYERTSTQKKDGSPGDDLTRVQMQFELGCADTGEVYSSIMWGEGQDSGDKGFYKAYTGAVKYFLMKTFLIATGDDPEQDPQPRATETATYQPRQSAPQAATPRPAQPNGNTPMCDVCNIPARLGKDGKSYFCPNKDAHGGKWYTIPAVAAGATDTDLF